MDRWYIQQGPESDVIISSRIRLARNFKKYVFPVRLTDEQAANLIRDVKDIVCDINSQTDNQVKFFEFDKLEFLDKQTLVEKHLISPNFIKSDKIGGIILSEDETISIMVNEEDHLRIQSLMAGFSLKEAWNVCDKIDDIIQKRSEFAFDEDYGYLTSCPTNIGTGIRSSLMMHLPAITMTGKINDILEACSKIGITVRGLYGENTQALGNMFQISNQVTLGNTETDIISNVSSVSAQIIEQERILRESIYKLDKNKFEDKVYRSYGILSNARMISCEESLKLISDVRLGVDMGIIKNIETEKLNEITLIVQPATLQKTLKVPLDTEERDVRRAEFIRNKLVI